MCMDFFGIILSRVDLASESVYLYLGQIWEVIDLYYKSGKLQQNYTSSNFSFPPLLLQIQ